MGTLWLGWPYMSIYRPAFKRRESQRFGPDVSLLLSVTRNPVENFDIHAPAKMVFCYGAG